MDKTEIVKLAAKVIEDSPELFKEIYTMPLVTQQDFLIKSSFSLGVGKAMTYFLKLVNEKIDE